METILNSENILYTKSGFANCHPLAKCRPQSLNLQPARCFSAQNIHFKTDNKNSFSGKNLQLDS